jgi:putative ABC transport system permease protein
MNDRRGVLVGVCKASRTFQTFPIVYTRFSQAVLFAPTERKVLSFVLAKASGGWTPQEVFQEIRQATGLAALTQEQFTWKTIVYYMRRTGIPINFGITVLLGFIVGTAIAGQTFYLFTIENIRQFGALKAMGTSNRRIVGMVLLQALQVGLIGYGLGIGGAALFGLFTKYTSKLAFLMPWQVPVITGGAVMAMILLSSLLSIRKVLVIEPAIVFKG